MFRTINFQNRVARKVLRAAALLVFTLSVVCLMHLLTKSRSVYGSEQELDRLNHLVQTSRSSDPAAKTFRQGRDFVADEEWSRAAERFSEVVGKYPNSDQVDAALYWLAFTLKKQERYQEADQKLERLVREFPKSRWVDDARAMRIELAPQLGKVDIINEEAKQASKAAKANKAKKADTNDDPQNTTEYEIKLVALQSLFQANPERATAIVADILKPGSTAPRKFKEAAVSLLGQHGGKQAASMLMDLARNEPDTRIRKRAIFSLGQSPDEAVFDLLKSLATGSNEDIAEAAVFAITQRDSERASPVLRELARSAQSIRIRRQAIFWLGQRRGDAALDELIKIYDTDPSQEIRKDIVFAISRMRSERAAAKLLDIARSADNVEIRRQAVFWIGQHGGEQATSNLIQLYDAEKDERIKEHILLSLGQSCTKPGMRKLMEVAKSDPSVNLRKKAVFWLGHCSDPEAAKFIEELLK